MIDSTVGRRAPEKRKAALAGAASAKFHSNINDVPTSPADYTQDRVNVVVRQNLSKQDAGRLADEYRAAAARNAVAAIELGGRHGNALLRLAQHYARRAVALGVQAGGVRT